MPSRHFWWFRPEVGRTLTGGGYTNQANMTSDTCIDYCTIKGFTYAGTELSSMCYCGMSIASNASQAPTSDCASACAGNSTQPCGGSQRLNMFWSNTTGPQINPGNNSWAFAGCYTDGANSRTLPNGVATVGGSVNMTVATCTTACRQNGYNLAGMESGGQCWCAPSIMNGGTLAPEGVSGCNQLCNGNLSEYCGGTSRLSVYDFNRTVTLPPLAPEQQLRAPA
ncbi:hypothetical protein BP5796_02275 [Coleophoma crateriformis]|uniref:WSC domain-containing protein n=1 Tax=Coleophoma crateriformis TaxID=565419 RepID=A0A3D8SXX5_9HELO|nr:hypothetical protein BP5796_02275 [Coleophoma crateriformis]